MELSNECPDASTCRAASADLSGIRERMALSYSEILVWKLRPVQPTYSVGHYAHPNLYTPECFGEGEGLLILKKIVWWYSWYRMQDEGGPTAESGKFVRISRHELEPSPFFFSVVAGEGGRGRAV